jgi:transposase
VTLPRSAAGWLSGAQPGEISVDPFHLVQLANLTVTRVRQRLVRDREHRRGRKVDPAWAHRTLLLRGYDTLSDRGKARLQTVFGLDDPTDELSAAWGVKEQVRRILNSSTVEAAHYERMILGCYVVAADMDETWRLWTTIDTWWLAIEVLIQHRVTNARTEAANTGIKQIKRTGWGYRNPAHYQARIRLFTVERGESVMQGLVALR